MTAHMVMARAIQQVPQVPCERCGGQRKRRPRAQFLVTCVDPSAVEEALGYRWPVRLAVCADCLRLMGDLGALDWLERAERIQWGQEPPYRELLHPLARKIEQAEDQRWVREVYPRYASELDMLVRRGWVQVVPCQRAGEVVEEGEEVSELAWDEEHDPAVARREQPGRFTPRHQRRRGQRGEWRETNK